MFTEPPQPWPRATQDNPDEGDAVLLSGSWGQARMGKWLNVSLSQGGQVRLCPGTELGGRPVLVRSCSYGSEIWKRGRYENLWPRCGEPIQEGEVGLQGRRDEVKAAQFWEGARQGCSGHKGRASPGEEAGSVSYTHLTLPTIRA